MTHSFSLTTIFASALFFFGPTLHSYGQGFIEHLQPPVLERGKTTRVTLVGSKLGKGVGLWSSLPAGAVKATPVSPSSSSQAVLEVTVAEDAPVGICGVRLATVDGLSNACLLLIDDLPVLHSHAELGNEGLGVTKVRLPASIWGRFREAQVDRFVIQVNAGQTVSFEAVANRLGKDMDPLIRVRDAKGKIVAERDNDAGLYFDFRFEHTFADAGSYTVELCDARFHGSEHGFYVLRMGQFPATRVALPMAIQWNKRFKFQFPGIDPLLPDPIPSEQEKMFEIKFPPDAAGLFFGVVKRKGDEGSAWLPMEATSVPVAFHQGGFNLEGGTPAKVPSMLCGILQKPGEKHFYRLELAKGQKIQVRVEAKAFNSPADLEISLIDEKGKELRRVGENPQKDEILLDFTAGNPGVYGLMVRDIHRDGGPAFGYRLDVRTPGPMVQILADAEGLTLPQGDYQTVPLTVTRTDYAGPIQLSLVGTPPGVTLTPSEIGEGVTSIVCKLAAAADMPIGIHTIQIRAEFGESANEQTPGANAPRLAFARVRPLIDRQIVNVDLIPYGLREDQLRLPPTLTDRFAVQVTPTPFFTFELPESMATLGRYQQVDFPIVINRKKGFDGPISFSAKGGQIAPKKEGRTRVYAEFVETKGSIHSKILTNLAKHRVDVTALGINSKDGRKATLTRTFDLEIRAAFVLNAEPALVKMETGTSAKISLNVERMKNFDSEVAVQLTPTLGIEMPTMVVIPKGQNSVEVEIKVDEGQPSGRRSINLNGTALINGLEEEQRGRMDIEVVKSAGSKK